LKKWKRKCPKCGEEIPYSRIYERNRAEKRNTICKSCAYKELKRSEETKQRISKNNVKHWLGKSRSEEVKKKMSKNHADFSEKNNPMYGKSVYDIWIDKYGKEEADKRWIEKSKKISESHIGIKLTDERKKNMRLSALKRNGITFPNHNPVACGIINDYNKKYNFNFRHAENGGEVCIGGYFPDGVDEKRKTIIEIDEKHHFNLDGTYKEKDIQRQEYLESLGYKFIRIKI
jgi:hypothetical protein